MLLSAISIDLFSINILTNDAMFIGIHRESTVDGLSELDLELQRRTWCILECWDW